MSEQGLKTEYAVVARASRPGPLPFVLKDGETFAVFDPLGDVRADGADDLGVFHEGARHVSALELRLWDRRPLLLSSNVREDNCLFIAHLTNPDLFDVAGPLVAKGTLHLQRSSVLTAESCLQELVITNYADADLTVPITLRFDADFRDIFEVRGMTRARRGTCRRTARDGAVRLVYRGLDRRERVSILRIGGRFVDGRGDAVTFEVEVPARGSARACFLIDFRDAGADSTPEARFDRAVVEMTGRFRESRQAAALIHTSNEQFNLWLNRSFADLQLLATPTPTGLYPYAGVPWYSTPFGRDGIIAARQALMVDPRLARGVLAYLAANQASVEDPDNDAEPGKILHEARLGEMAALREIPFGRYYGSVDSTPLFIVLAGDYLRRTDDVDFLRSIAPNIEAALDWMRAWGDVDGDGFIEYHRRAGAGLRNQGWKDSEDSISHADGSLAEGPIALCEVQAYAYAALHAAASIVQSLDQPDRAAELLRKAGELKRRFAAAFWRPELETYALALDGRKRPCDVRASNAGHALWAGIAEPDHAAAVARALLSPTSFNGWGVRTLDEREARYNPMSYHNGSVWPHDNALIALGLARYGLKHEALRIATGLFDASMFMPMHRLPELFCGFARRDDEGPTLYPVACMPQAWASGAVFAFLEAFLGLSVTISRETGRPTVRFTNPVLPPYLEQVWISHLRVGDEEVDLELHRYETDVGVNAVRRAPRVDVVITK